MSSFLFRVGRLAVRWRWVVIAAWILVAVGIGALAQNLGGALTSSFAIPGTPAQTALDELEERFPQLAGASGRIVLVAADGSSIDDEDTAIATVCEDVAALDGVTGVSCPVAMDASGATAASDGESSQISADGTMAFVTVQLAEQTVSAHLAGQIEKATATATGAGMSVALSGLGATASGGVDWTELAGLAIAFVVLAITFGAVIAAGIPLITAVTGVVVASSGILVVAAFVPVSSTAPLLATMLGLAVGIDYALLIVSRHRAQLAEGMSAAESIPVAIATAGTAVVFAGTTVMIALLGLAVAGIPFLSVMGLGAAAAVLGALAVAVTLLPALLAVLGRLVRPHRRRKKRVARTPLWGRAAIKVPLATVALVCIALIALAVPAASLRLTLPDAGYDPPGSPERTAYDLLAEGFGPGFNGPLLITADISGTLKIEDALKALDDHFADVPDVATVSQAFPNEALDLAVITITPDSSPSSERTAELVRSLRNDAASFEAENGFTYAVTGQTALAIDISDRLSAALIPFAIVVVGLCLVLLTIMFRSIAVPITATFGYLLSVGAALGVTTAVFEWGWGASLLGVGKVGPVISFLPILVMAVLFGLAMDYHVFLVSRMRERFAADGDARAAVLGGFSASARVVTAAALIMFSVFFSFVPGGSAVIQPLAMALAVGVLIDAFVVRMTLIPALMALLGARAWWLPTWLARALPNADIEGEAVERMRAQQGWLARTGLDAEEVPGIHAHDAVLGDGSQWSLDAPRGALVVLEGEPAAASLAVASLSGRDGRVTGDLSVHGRLVPFERHALAAVAAYVPARAEHPDATTLHEHLAGTLRADGVALRERRERLLRAARVFDELTEIVSGPAARSIAADTAWGALDDDERWAADAAAAATSGREVLAVDIGLRAQSSRLAGILVAAADRHTSVVLAGVAGPVDVAGNDHPRAVVVVVGLSVAGVGAR